MISKSTAVKPCVLILLSFLVFANLAEAAITNGSRQPRGAAAGRERTSLNAHWRFERSTTSPDNLVYDHREDTPGDAQVLKSWILPSANDFIKDPAKHHKRPRGNPSGDIAYVQTDYDDSGWELVDLPHDWAIKGPFYTSDDPVVGGGMGRLPVHGIGWYRRKLTVDPSDEGRSVYLDIDGAMSYAMVWLNGNLVGGWPFGYSSFRLDLTPYLKPGDDNQLAIRLDNPVKSSRWYPGGGIYRNVWLVKVDSTHVAQWGTSITTKDVSAQSATVELSIQIENRGESSRQIDVVTDVHLFDPATGRPGEKVAAFPPRTIDVRGGQKQLVNSSVVLESPQLWGPRPSQHPNLYVAVTRLSASNATTDSYETRFGVRSLAYTGDKGLFVNGEHVRIQGVNQHHDLGALGAAFNYRAAERQLEVLQEMGSNAIRMSHNPPAPELLDLADQMGFLVMDEAFDCWQRQKNPNDFHLIFDDWSEPDLRAMLRRDRNHPSIFVWSIGNEVGEQSSGDAGAALARRLMDMVHDEDPTRPGTASMNAARSDQPFPESLDVTSLNYQGEGVRDTPPYANLSGTRTPPSYADFHSRFPDKMLLGSETAATVSTRRTYLFPVTGESSAPQTDAPGGGGDPDARQVSAYELYTAGFGASPDKVFRAQDGGGPYVAGEFVWAGRDYLGEPTPYYSARSAYFGIVDLCGFPKDRFHLYRARWRPELRSAHILPHWDWPGRAGLVTPVHVFAAADEAELFLNGESQGRVAKGDAPSYRFRWDGVVYRPGALHVATFRDGAPWANETVRTAGAPARLRLTADRRTIRADGRDLSFVTLEVVDGRGDVVPRADDAVRFAVDGPGEIVATDNGDPYDMVAFPSTERRAFGGLALAIVRARPGSAGTITLTATGAGLAAATLVVTAQ